MAEAVARGIDISSHQGEVDFARVKAAGYSFVIIKAGQGLRQMGTFREKYLPAVRAAGLDWGAYWWSDAVTVAEAQAEARAFLAALDGLKPTYPVYMDQEYKTPYGNAWGLGRGKQLRTDMANAFLQVIQDAGYYAGLYASKNWLEHWVDAAQLTAWDKWVAQYAPECTYAGAYGMWQHHGDAAGFVGRCPGINTPVDLNACYRDYPAIIKRAGLNGWGAADPEKPQEDMVPRSMYEDEKAAREAAEARCETLKAESDERERQRLELSDKLEAIKEIVGV